MPHGVACENSHLSLLHAARDISPGYMVWQIKMGNVKQDTIALASTQTSFGVCLSCIHFSRTEGQTNPKGRLRGGYNGTCLTLSRTQSEFFVHASLLFPAPCLVK